MEACCRCVGHLLAGQLRSLVVRIAFFKRWCQRASKNQPPPAASYMPKNRTGSDAQVGFLTDRAILRPGACPPHPLVGTQISSVFRPQDASGARRASCPSPPPSRRLKVPMLSERRTCRGP